MEQTQCVDDVFNVDDVFANNVQGLYTWSEEEMLQNPLDERRNLTSSGSNLYDTDVWDSLLNPLQSPWPEFWFDTTELQTSENGLEKLTMPGPSAVTSCSRLHLDSEDIKVDKVVVLEVDELHSLLNDDGGGDHEVLSDPSDEVTVDDMHSLVASCGSVAMTWPLMEHSHNAEGHNVMSHDADQSSLASDNDEDDDAIDEDSDASWVPAVKVDRGRHRTNHRRITKPYTRRHSTKPGEERKKEQNKNAATRYREKKRSEELKNEIECSRLEKRNRELRARVDDMTHEISVLRTLIIDIFRKPTYTVE
jgi:hypothetical protein